MDPDRALLITCLDLTELRDDGDERDVHTVCARALRPVPAEPALRVAAVCVWPRWISVAGGDLSECPVKIACATGGFPVPDAPLEDRLGEIEQAVAAGVDEVDVPINRFLVDEPDALRGELAATRRAAGRATWKAIVETGALEGGEIRTLAAAAIEAGVVRDAGRGVGLKLSGGIRGVAQAINHLEQVRGILGRDWPEPRRFRIGASTLLDALVA